MKIPVSTLLVAVSAFFLSSPATSEAPPDTSQPNVAPRCESALDRAAGQYSRCLLTASGRFANRGNEDELTIRQDQCHARFDSRVARAFERYGREACTPFAAEMANRTVTYAEETASQAAGKTLGPKCAAEADFSGKFGHGSMDYQGYSRETAEVSAGVWPEPWEFEIVPGDFKHAFTVLNAANDQVKAMCIAQPWQPAILECMDVDDLGIFTFKATEISSECSVMTYIYVHRELGGSCDEEADVNCPGQPFMSTSVGRRIDP
ncbi:MAG: hypothetical protein P8M78_09595 [Myxococcota bacterium]|nr:hypothetical protein [Myxococcota bacterium]